MRFKIKQKHLTERIKEKFVFFLITKRWDKREITILEKVKIHQTWYAFGDDIRVKLFGGYWENDWVIKK
jgi:hypothetical protein